MAGEEETIVRWEFRRDRPQASEHETYQRDKRVRVRFIPFGPNIILPVGQRIRCKPGEEHEAWVPEGWAREKLPELVEDAMDTWRMCVANYERAKEEHFAGQTPRADGTMKPYEGDPPENLFLRLVGRPRRKLAAAEVLWDERRDAVDTPESRRVAEQGEIIGRALRELGLRPEHFAHVAAGNVMADAPEPKLSAEELEEQRAAEARAAAEAEAAAAESDARPREEAVGLRDAAAAPSAAHRTGSDDDEPEARHTRAAVQPPAQPRPPRASRAPRGPKAR